MAKVKLREGFGEHYIRGKEGIVEVKPGDVVTLSESQMAAFGDKFEPANTGRSASKKGKTPAPNRNPDPDAGKKDDPDPDEDEVDDDPAPRL